ncbi:hypothetical protein [Planktothrix sp. FACHB-1365]|uniref:hypothetical protein n=1 Tax=Planktothrix sp. FACHB-1365 TaxID=2692855 RepID=UPI001688CDF5|nr:hypothetical protein [Planktothrix sp. FACHB-1365]MBD2485873.1 hypothetical protein [Planktothrix sp. FACHB-1365]
MRDFELEMLACDDETVALEYIGEGAQAKNIFQGKKTRKRKSDHSDDYLPLFMPFKT